MTGLSRGLEGPGRMTGLSRGLEGPGRVTGLSRGLEGSVLTLEGRWDPIVFIPSSSMLRRI